MFEHNRGQSGFKATITVASNGFTFRCGDEESYVFETFSALVGALARKAGVSAMAPGLELVDGKFAPTEGRIRAVK